MASPSAPLPPSVEAPSEDPKQELLKQIRSHEVAVAELNCLPSNRAVYQRNGNLFFRKSVMATTAHEQKQLDSAKARLQKMSAI
ncbi:hypothetical protein Taro_009788 [Colocasia esculenta]|uniref:Uncharacterized protein n=1 Tax=Colocasia esculenta TaxID=4460 RepID=A0A843TX75_COLES|nr:hypothetical protein [Colocasia esculenta]